MQRGEHDTERRYQYGPRWFRNSCAVDCAVVSAIMLDIGRLRVDQISPASYEKLNIEAALLRRIVSKPWGLLSDEQRFHLREVLRHHLETANPVDFPLNAYQPVGDVLAHVFDRLPQMSWTSCRGLVCCDGRLQADKLVRVRRRAGFVLLFASGDEYTVGEKLQYERLDPSSNPEEQRSTDVLCNFEGNCARVLSPLMVVLDRLPPTLFIRLGPIPEGNNRTLRHMFDRINIRCNTPHGLTAVSYLPMGCIFLTGGNHFILRWQITARGVDIFMEYDGMLSAKFVKVQGWWDTLSTSAVPVALFYRQIQL